MEAGERLGTMKIVWQVLRRVDEPENQANMSDGKHGKEYQEGKAKKQKKRQNTGG